LSKRLKIYYFLTFIALTWIILANVTSKKPVNWMPSFVAEHKMPYGTYVLREELPELFPNTEVKDIQLSPYMKLKDPSVSGTYFFVNDAVNFGDEEFNLLLEFVERGNDVFISKEGGNVDTLNLKTRTVTTRGFFRSLELKISNPNLDTISREFNDNFSKLGFSEIDTLNTEVLGTIRLLTSDNSVDREEVNFIRRKHGKGNFYFHLFPFAFTNFNMLKDDRHRYVASALSYIDEDKPILWDTYYKTGKSRITSPMYYVLNSPSLKWAYYVALIGVVFFVFFQGKRTQRLIPIIIPLKNQTLAFARTLAGMYFEKKDHKSISHQAITYFLDYIRTHLNMSTANINDSFYADLAGRSGNTVESVKQLFELIKELEAKNYVSKEELQRLNTAIDEFKSHQ